MKKLVLLMLALLLVGGVYAQPILFDQSLNLESFRHQATYSIEDDLDNGIDGTDIFAVKGARIFTNLSNLADGEERQGDNSYSDNTLVIGGISPVYQGWKAALIYGDRNSLESYESSSETIDQWDSNLNDTFDLMTYLHNTSSEGGSSLDNCILLNIGKRMGEETEIAFTYKRTESKDLENYLDSTYYRYATTPEDSAYYLYNDFENGDYEYSTPTNIYTLSYSKPFRDWKLRGDVYLLSGGLKMIENELNYYFYDDDPSDSNIINTTLNSTLGIGLDDIGVSVAGIGLRLSDLNDGLLWEVSGNFGMIFGSGDYEYSNLIHNIDQFMLLGNVATLDDSSLSNTTAPISVSGMNMDIGGRIEWQLSENVRFGLGLMYTNLSVTLEFNYDESSTTIADWDDGDAIVNDVDDYVAITTSGTLYTGIDDISMSSIVIPTGLEVCVGKNKDWFIRFGAISTTGRETYTYTEEVDSVIRGQTIVAYGDGIADTTFVGSIAQNDNDYSSSYDYQGVDFAYGLGWKPSPNLSLDLIGMFDVDGVELLSTDWLASLRLSATINIY